MVRQFGWFDGIANQIYELPFWDWNVHPATLPPLWLYPSSCHTIAPLPLSSSLLSYPAFIISCHVNREYAVPVADCDLANSWMTVTRSSPIVQLLLLLMLLVLLLLSFNFRLSANELSDGSVDRTSPVAVSVAFGNISIGGDSRNTIRGGITTNICPFRKYVVLPISSIPLRWHSRVVLIFCVVWPSLLESCRRGDKINS